MARAFDHAPAVRRSVPVLLGLFGPSGSGKTFTALRLAAGMERVTKKPTFFIDTEAGRALHYADLFKFEHVPFLAPFDPLSYLEAFRYCKAQGAGQIVGDSLSHVWEGEGGVLAMHEAEVDRMAGNDFAKRERVKMAGWIKPKAQIRQLINGLLQIESNFLFCFRAKEKVKLVTVQKNGKSVQEPIGIGFQPIIGDEFPYEMTMNLFLPPASNGVPDLAPAEVGERAMLKIPAQFKSIMIPDRVLDEQIGERLALWAAGGPIESKPATREPAAAGTVTIKSHSATPADDDAKLASARVVMQITATLKEHGLKTPSEAAAELGVAFTGKTWGQIKALPADELAAGLAVLKKNLDGVAELARERQMGEDDGE